jgi:hypothetical protein
LQGRPSFALLFLFFLLFLRSGLHITLQYDWR